mmetsp:Transcript_57267/g.102356  ORF Transcript_57267/g.102356 Transcript_57267/m.102356 type:complete len:214 (-) Transcript_57267:433-1074(-)
MEQVCDGHQRNVQSRVESLRSRICQLFETLRSQLMKWLSWGLQVLLRQDFLNQLCPAGVLTWGLGDGSQQLRDVDVHQLQEFLDEALALIPLLKLREVIQIICFKKLFELVHIWKIGNWDFVLYFDLGKHLFNVINGLRLRLRFPKILCQLHTCRANYACMNEYGLNAVQEHHNFPIKSLHGDGVEHVMQQCCLFFLKEVVVGTSLIWLGPKG